MMMDAIRLQTPATSTDVGNTRVFRAPGRVNLIGEHTDYNDGFVMPAAINLATEVEIAPRDDRTVSVYSESFGEQFEFDLDDPKPVRGSHWSDYVRGVAVLLEETDRHVRGANLRIRSEVPIGSGLSSSAALEVATANALLETSGIDLTHVELAKLCQRAENEFVGMHCGIMDQFISCFGEEGHALMLDCRSLEYKQLPLPENARLVISNTMVKHELAGGEYNARRAQCEAGVHHFAQSHPNVRALRDVSLAELERAAEDLSALIYHRCRHVITENARVLEAAKALEQGELEAFGQLMNDSHRSLRDDFEVSCRELDLIVELAQGISGVYGSRMTGGGFGGSTVSLVETENVEEFKREVESSYREATGLTPEIYVCKAAAGAEEVSRSN